MATATTGGRADEPVGWANWRAARAGRRELGALEFAWYTDIWPTGEIKGPLGPLLILNPVSASARDETALALVARVSLHGQRPTARRIRLRTEYSRWVGVDMGQEFASLVSLAYGMRCRSGGVTRVFDPRDTDPRGEPTAWNAVAAEVPRPSYYSGHQLPRMAWDAASHKRQVPLDNPAALDLLERYPFISQRKAVGLVRSARLYSQAIWEADVNPEQAWLLLVSACEAAAATAYGSYDKMNPRRRTSERSARLRLLRFADKYQPDPPE
jgi:hypothetical protein